MPPPPPPSPPPPPPPLPGFAREAKPAKYASAGTVQGPRPGPDPAGLKGNERGDLDAAGTGGEQGRTGAAGWAARLGGTRRRAGSGRPIRFRAGQGRAGLKLADLKLAGPGRAQLRRAGGGRSKGDQGGTRPVQVETWKGLGMSSMVGLSEGRVRRAVGVEAVRAVAAGAAVAGRFGSLRTVAARAGA